MQVSLTFVWSKFQRYPLNLIKIIYPGTFLDKITADIDPKNSLVNCYCSDVVKKNNNCLNNPFLSAN